MSNIWFQLEKPPKPRRFARHALLVGRTSANYLT